MIPEERVAKKLEKLLGISCRLKPNRRKTNAASERTNRLLFGTLP